MNDEGEFCTRAKWFEQPWIWRSDLGSNAIWESCESIHIASREIQEKKRAPLL